MHLDMMSFDYEPNNYDPQSSTNYPGELTENFFTNLTTANINLTETQNELVEKFNAAFVEAQNSPKFYHQSQTEQFHPHHPPQQQQFPENFDTNSETNFLLDIFMSKSPSQTTNSNPSTDLEHYGLFYDENSKPEQPDASVFYINPPTLLPAANNNTQRHFENLDDLCLSEIDFCDNISNSSFDIETITTELCENENIDFDYDNTCMEPRFVEPLPSVTTFGRNFAEKKYIELNNFIRHSAPDTINLFATETEQKNTYGHLLGNKPMNNNLSVVLPESNYEPVSSNQLVLTQTEAILHDDPLLSSSSCVFPNRRIRHRSDSSFTGSTYENSDAELDEANSLLFQCKWEDCYQLYPDQRTLVRHIEKSHVEMKKGEEFACSWINCPRKNKPFNARYKLLIHMRVHSGEKPNKCPFKGCSKAFSRLENLKIHQRSHTGERPYLCQFNQCTKSFSNSSDRAKHQRTHYDTKPYACQITGCQKRYTDPSSLRKHVKNHTLSEQAQLKKKQQINRDLAPPTKPPAHEMPEKREFKKISITHNTTQQFQKLDFNNDFLITELKNQKDHSYSTCHDIFENFVSKDLALKNVKIDLKNKISEKNRQKKLYENMY